MKPIEVTLDGAVAAQTPLGMFAFQDGDANIACTDLFMIDALRRWVHPGMVVADIGANVGYFTRLLAELVGEDGQVHAVEPVPTTFQLLLVNCPEPQVIPYRLAASNENGTATITLEADSSAGASLLPWQPPTNGGTVTVHTRRMGEMLPDLDFALVDTEGFDHLVMEGFAPKLPPTVILEHWVHDPLSGRTAAYDSHHVREKYHKMGYTITGLRDSNILLRREP